MGLTSTKVYDAPAAFQGRRRRLCGAAAAHPGSLWTTFTLAENLRPILPVVKAASAIGLASVRFPRAGAAHHLHAHRVLHPGGGVHVRARDWSPGLAASSFLGLFGAMTVGSGRLTLRVAGHKSRAFGP